MYMYMYMYITYTRMDVHVYVRIWQCVCIYIYVYMCVCTYKRNVHMYNEKLTNKDSIYIYTYAYYEPYLDPKPYTPWTLGSLGGQGPKGLNEGGQGQLVSSCNDLQWGLTLRVLGVLGFRDL